MVSNTIISSRFTSKEVERIDRCVDEGIARSRADFIRISTLMYLGNSKEIE